jgi:hypothetical protein
LPEIRNAWKTRFVSFWKHSASVQNIGSRQTVALLGALIGSRQFKESRLNRPHSTFRMAWGRNGPGHSVDVRAGALARCTAHPRALAAVQNATPGLEFASFFATSVMPSKNKGWHLNC